jgi:flagellin-like protein
MKSKIKGMLDDDRGVSPVIGVILMVAITVILAAVIGGFVLNLGGDLQSTPQAQLSIEKQVDDSGTNIVIEHNGGGALDADDFIIQYDDSDRDVWSDELSVGESHEVEDGANDGEHTVTVIHEPSDSIIVEGTVTVSS